MKIRLLNKILTVGTFDTPHLGHYNLFQQIKDLFPESQLVVGVNHDDFIERFKGKKPQFSFEDRCRLIEAINIVDEVLPNYGGEDSKVLIEKVNPDVIVVGSDWLRKDYLKQMSLTVDYLEDKKIALVYIPRYLNVSSTLIKSKV